MDAIDERPPHAVAGELRFFCPGVPRPKGSMKAFKSKAMRFAVVTNSSDKVKPWQATLALAAQEAGARPVSGPVALEVVSWFARPKGHFGTGKNALSLKAAAPEHPTAHNLGDADKLARVTLDALTGVAFEDDSQVVRLVSEKRWSNGEPLGMLVIVRPR